MGFMCTSDVDFIPLSPHSLHLSHRVHVVGVQVCKFHFLKAYGLDQGAHKRKYSVLLKGLGDAHCKVMTFHALGVRSGILRSGWESTWVGRSLLVSPPSLDECFTWCGWRLWPSHILSACRIYSFFWFWFLPKLHVWFFFWFFFCQVFDSVVPPINNQMFLLVHLTLNVGQLCILCPYYNFKCPFFLPEAQWDKC